MLGEFEEVPIPLNLFTVVNPVEFNETLAKASLNATEVFYLEIV